MSFPYSPGATSQAVGAAFGLSNFNNAAYKDDPALSLSSLTTWRQHAIKTKLLVEGQEQQQRQPGPRHFSKATATPTINPMLQYTASDASLIGAMNVGGMSPSTTSYSGALKLRMLQTAAGGPRPSMSGMPLSPTSPRRPQVCPLLILSSVISATKLISFHLSSDGAVPQRRCRCFHS